MIKALHHLVGYFKRPISFYIWTVSTVSFIALCVLQSSWLVEKEVSPRFLTALGLFYLVVLIVLGINLRNKKARRALIKSPEDLGYSGYLKKKYGPDHIDLMVNREIERLEYKPVWRYLILSVPWFALSVNIYLWLES